MPGWLRYVFFGAVSTAAVGFVARRILLAGYSYGGRLALVAVWIAVAGALASAVVAYSAPRRPYAAGVLTGFVSSIVAALVVFLPEYDPSWWPVALALAAGVAVIGAFGGVVIRWALKRDGPGSPGGARQRRP